MIWLFPCAACQDWPCEMVDLVGWIWMIEIEGILLPLFYLEYYIVLYNFWNLKLNKQYDGMAFDKFCGFLVEMNLYVDDRQHIQTHDNATR